MFNSHFTTFYIFQALETLLFAELDFILRATFSLRVVVFHLVTFVTGKYERKGGANVVRSQCSSEHEKASSDKRDFSEKIMTLLINSACFMF